MASPLRKSRCECSEQLRITTSSTTEVLQQQQQYRAVPTSTLNQSKSTLRTSMSDKYRGGGRGGGGYQGGRGGYPGGGGGRGGYQGGDRGSGGYQGGGGGRGGYQGGGGGRGGYQGGDRGSGQFEDKNMPMTESEVHKAIVPQNMAPGKIGEKVQLLANFYKIQTSDVVVFHYDVDITKAENDRFEKKKPTAAAPPKSEAEAAAAAAEAEEANKAFNRFLSRCSNEIIKTLMNTNQAIFKDVHYVWDGLRNLYTTKLLKLTAEEQIFNNLKVDIPGGKPGIFNLKVKRVDRVDLSEVTSFYDKKTGEISERVLTIFELLFRFMCTGPFESYQRKFFDMSTRRSMTKAPLADFVNGFISSVRMTEFGLALNVHLKTAGLITQSFTTLPAMVKCLAGVQNLAQTQLTDYQLREINKVIRHLKIFTNHGRGKIGYTVDRIIRENPQEMKFEQKDGARVSIAHYFKATYDMQLEALPLVQTSGKKRYLPMELCYLVDKQFLSNSKIDKQIQNELLLKSTHAPNIYFDRAKKIVEKISSLNPTLQNAFGLKSICPKPVQLTGRVLPPAPMTGKPTGPFYRGGTVPTKWGVLCLDHTVSQEVISTFVAGIQRQASQLGLQFASQPNPILRQEVKSKANIGNIFANLQQKTNAELVFVGIPTLHKAVPSAVIYNLTKHHCDQKFGIISCCFKSDYMYEVNSNNKRGYLENFLLKVNGKLNGQNMIIQPKVIQNQLPFKMARTMVMGVDVNHPGATEKVLSSISAAVGSYDDAFTKYSASIRVQKKTRDEMVKQLDSMTEELLNEYYKHNKYYPDNIFVFRDGVSEGQFEQVKEKEIPLIRAAIKKVNKSYKLTVIITQKRHHTRFVLTTAKQAGKWPSYNVPSGTVVDQSIVEPIYDVFYLNSHFSPLGTSKPTKYIRLLDELKMPTDDLQKFCFYACHNCVRTNKVIAIPAPVRYADLCAYRSKLHIEGQRELESFKESSSQEAEEQRIISQLNEWVKIHERVRNRLYYC